MELIRLSYFIHTYDKKIVINVNSIDAKDTGKSYVWPGHRLSYNKIMNVDSNHYTDGLVFGYFVFCLPDQIEKCIENIEQIIKDRIEDLVIKVENIKKIFDNKEEFKMIRYRSESD